MSVTAKSVTDTFVTPEIPFRDFAEHNPGHGTETVAETVRGLRDTYAATRIRKVTTPVGYQFVVTGPRIDVARLAALYGLPLGDRHESL